MIITKKIFFSIYFIALSFLALSANAQTFDSMPNLQVNFPQEQWILNVSTQVMDEREPRLEPEESVIGDALRPLLDSADYSGVAVLLENELSNGKQLSPALLHILGQVYMALQDNNKAQQSFQKAIAAMPNFARAHQRLGLLYLQQQQYDKARIHLSKTVSLGIADAETFGQLAFANLQDYSPWSAISGYQQALLLDPANSQWQQGLLFSLISAKNFSAAQALLDEMISADQDNIDLWLQSSNIALNNNEPLSALTRLEIALNLGNSDTSNQIVAAQLHLQYGSTARAVELMQSTISNSSEYYSTIEEAIAWLIFNQQWQEAERLISAGLEHWTSLSALQESQLLAHRGTLALAQNSIDDASTFLTQAIDIDPSNGEALLALADLQSQRQRYVQAALLYTRAASITAFQEQALLGHAQLAVDQKDYQQAVDLLTKALQANPSRQDLNQNIQMLNRIILNGS